VAKKFVHQYRIDDEQIKTIVEIDRHITVRGSSSKKLNKECKIEESNKIKKQNLKYRMKHLNSID